MRRRASKRRLWRRLITLTASGVLLVGLVGWLSVVLRFARRVVTPPGTRLYDVRVVSHDLVNRRVVLESTPDTRLPGEYLLVSPDYRSWLVCGEIMTSEHGRVTRRVIEASSHLASGTDVRFTGWRWVTPGAANLPASSVGIDISGGTAPAWQIRERPESHAHSHVAEHASRDNVWAVHIHGRASQRQEALRGVVSTAGVIRHHLVVSYRNDGVAPASRWGRYTLGSAEWRDVEQAIEYAVEQGASKIVLYGWSMGATLALQCAAHALLRDRIAAIVLDSPALDWVNILRFHARLSRVPRWIARHAQWFLELGLVQTDEAQSLSFRTLDASNVLRNVSTPILILHSAQDGYVPITPARKLALRYPEQVRLEEWATARHCKLWNYDPERYEHSVRAWLTNQLESAL